MISNIEEHPTIGYVPYSFQVYSDPKEITKYLAEKYLSWGFIPIPIRLSYKQPAGKFWLNTEPQVAALNIDRFLVWYKKRINLGIICGGNLHVLDIDSGGCKKMEELIATHGPIDTFTVKTGGGGWHYYFTNSPIGTCVKMKGIDWDMRGTGSQVLGPGSIHPITGKPYKPVAGFVADNVVAKAIASDNWNGSMMDIFPIINPMPQWLVDFIK